MLKFSSSIKKLVLFIAKIAEGRTILEIMWKCSVSSVSSCPTNFALHTSAGEENCDIGDEDEDDHGVGGSYGNEGRVNETEEVPTREAERVYAKDISGDLELHHRGIKSADEVLKDRRKYLEISVDRKKPWECLFFFVSYLHYKANALQINNLFEKSKTLKESRLMCSCY